MKGDMIKNADYDAITQTLFVIAAGLFLGDSWTHTFGIIFALLALTPYTPRYWKRPTRF